MDRLKRFGIQKRIMLYVTVGLAVLFGSFAIVGLRSIQQAIDLLYDERLNVVHTTAAILARDFLHVARGVGEPRLGSAAGEQGPEATTRILLEDLARTDPSPFFHVVGVWVLTPDGRIVALAGRPVPIQPEETRVLLAAATHLPEGDFLVLPAVAGYSPGDTPFATVVTHVTDSTGATHFLAAVHTTSINSVHPYVPPSYWYVGSAGVSASPPNLQATYHLEVVNPEGLVVLGIGEDERPGLSSWHLPALRKLTAEGRAGVLLHEPVPGQTFEPHVMAAAPLESSGFWVVLEQPVDVALALPLEVRRNILVLTTLGFGAALVTAWITTGHVVKPTRELTAAAQRMAQGDLDTPIRVAAQDEVGSLAESLDLMRGQLKAASGRIEDANRGLEGQVRERTARLEEVLKKVISAQEDERHRLARELHDETAQTLGALCIALDRAREGLGDASPGARDRLMEAKASATRLLEETRRLILDLRPMVLDDLGLGPAVRWYAETHLEERGVQVVVEVDERATRLPQHVEVSLFRVTQEAINNVARHANARHAHIRLARQEDAVRVVIDDDGDGFEVGRVLGPGTTVESIGLVGMQERVRLLNGRLDIRSRAGEGTTVTVEIPIPGESA